LPKRSATCCSASAFSRASQGTPDFCLLFDPDPQAFAAGSASIKTHQTHGEVIRAEYFSQFLSEGLKN
jgi:hypothetical protein